MKPAGGVPPENAPEKYATTCRDMHESARNQDALPLPSQGCPDASGWRAKYRQDAFRALVHFLNRSEEDFERHARTILMQAFDRAPPLAAAPSGTDRQVEPGPMHSPVFLGHDHIHAFSRGLGS
jgi:hypothetical protein